MARIIYITGGQRSGKSAFAEQMALNLSPRPVYLATSRVWDEGHRQRIEQHQQRRGDQWTTVEEETRLGRHDFRGRIVLVDCVTLWLTNLFFDNESDVGRAHELATAELDALFLQEAATYIFVSNELGLGGHSPSDVMFRFADLQGLVNQEIARASHEAYMVLSGLPLRLK